MAGIMRVKEGAVDFGASDMPMPSEELRKLGLVQFPIVIGGVVAVVNLDGVGLGSQAHRPVLADIFLGKVPNWSDPAIRALNPRSAARREDRRRPPCRRLRHDLQLHQLPRQGEPDGQTVGSDLLVPWPEARRRATRASHGTVRQTPNSIGYVEFAHARSRLAYALIRNRAGSSSSRSRSFQAAAASAEWKARRLHLLLTDTPGEAAYPIAATVFVLMSKARPPPGRRAQLLPLVLDKGAASAALGYVPLPPGLIAK